MSHYDDYEPPWSAEKTAQYYEDRERAQEAFKQYSGAIEGAMSCNICRALVPVVNRISWPMDVSALEAHIEWHKETSK